MFNFFSKRPRREEININYINNNLIEILMKVDRLRYLQEKIMAIEKEEIKQLLSIVTRLVQTNVEDRSQVQALQAEAAELRAKTDWLNDPEMDAELDSVLASAAGAAPANEVPTVPGEPVEPVVPEEPPVITGGPAASATDPTAVNAVAPEVEQPSIAEADPVGQDNLPDFNNQV